MASADFQNHPDNLEQELEQKIDYAYELLDWATGDIPRWATETASWLLQPQNQEATKIYADTLVSNCVGIVMSGNPGSILSPALAAQNPCAVPEPPGTGGPPDPPNCQYGELQPGTSTGDSGIERTTYAATCVTIYTCSGDAPLESYTDFRVVFFIWYCQDRFDIYMNVWVKGGWEDQQDEFVGTLFDDKGVPRWTFGVGNGTSESGGPSPMWRAAKGYHYHDNNGIWLGRDYKRNQYYSTVGYPHDFKLEAESRWGKQGGLYRRYKV